MKLLPGMVVPCHCVDHLLEFVTEVALKDYPESIGVMQAAKDLVSYFSSSSQASETLLSLQELVTQSNASKMLQLTGGQHTQCVIG